MIFVTGGSGLIGSYLIPALLERGLAVRALYREKIPAYVPGADRVTWLEGDVRDSGLLREALAGVTHVFHCAGVVSYAPQDRELLKQVNIEGTAAVVDACLNQPGVRLCHVSSVAALGGLPENATSSVLDESAKWDLNAEHSAYATSKYLGELEVWRGISEGLNAVIVNPSVVLGATDWTRSSTRLFRYAHQEHAFYTPGSVNFVDVRDVVSMMLHLTLDSQASGERYVLSADSLPLRDFFAQAAACFGKKPPTVGVPDWAAEIIWRVEHLRGMLTGSRPLITKDTARASRRPVEYRAAKVQAATGLQFRPVAETIRWCCAGLAAAPNSVAPGAVVVS
ncbi:NAD-dependent epimerase/dehydratase family protein [Hymenobacter busanensis]|uniref:NAD-dependent epimerase/dehydratase family protein n=1 Tax=Hymenobacter busanensis TaxID=2607656 RepID=A0A7L4ZZW1_9BACT|nr:NAD-dependent epimerase/dehydratase family protein [Hymenobacter busanensis]KAA9331647.1 NAD-dependent epimerase/dehydratase family protein [Hymenobacter busanensis]QHJ08798.1 NAD-dependent epimerase/dehydratase family protein [Hymenobacter busanensis]